MIVSDVAGGRHALLQRPTPSLKLSCPTPDKDALELFLGLNLGCDPINCQCLMSLITYALP